MGANALFTAVSGLDLNQTYLGVIGNDIANSNTIGYKSSNPIFENLVSQTLSGTSSSQEGLGADVLSIQQQFGQGALQTTSNPLNMAIDGNGFFIVKSPGGSTYYTRNGTFSENSAGQIVDSTGQNIVQGYPLNSNGIATAGTPSAITLNTGAIPPLATTTANLTANLNSTVSPQTAATTAGTFTGGYMTSSASKGSNTINVDANNLFVANQQILIGNGDGTTNLYTVKSVSGTAGAQTITLVQSLTSPILQNTAVSQNTLTLSSTAGINTGDSIQADLTNNTAVSSTVDPYQFLNTVASVNATSNEVNLSNAMPIPSGSSFVAGGGVIDGSPSDYYSTTINVYDSLGNALPATVTFAPSSSTAGNWNVYYSINGTAAQRSSLNLTTPYNSPDVIFNSNGQITSGSSQTLTDVPVYAGTPITLPDNASAPLNISLNLANLTQYAATSATTAFTQNGYATGTLTSFTVDQSGRISGQFSNGQTEYLYQVALANFIAPTGLVSEGNSLYAQSVASGQPAVDVANSGNLGYITDSSLEQSNVNISSEFTNMIIAQNAYVANSKVLTTENAVLTAMESAVP